VARILGFVDERRKRVKRIEAGSPRYLTFSCHRRLALLGSAEWRDEFVRVLVGAKERCGFLLWAWVVMPEHAHVIMVPTEEWPVERVMRAIKQPIAQRAIRRWRKVGAPVLEELKVGKRYRYWQAGGGFDRNIRDLDELRREVDYINKNPVERGLVERAVDWEWSSARWYAGEREGQVEIDEIQDWDRPRLW
jgi:putative transposase